MLIAIIINSCLCNCACCIVSIVSIVSVCIVSIVLCIIVCMHVFVCVVALVRQGQVTEREGGAERRRSVCGFQSPGSPMPLHPPRRASNALRCGYSHPCPCPKELYKLPAALFGYTKLLCKLCWAWAWAWMSQPVRSVFIISCLFLRPRPWQFEIWDSTDK